MIGGRLTMRAIVERNTASGRDNWGQPVAPTWSVVGAVRCFAWSNQSRELVDGDKTAMVEDIRMMVARGTDITENDEVAAITDTKGNVLISGRLRVEGPVQHKHNHLELALTRVA